MDLSNGQSGGGHTFGRNLYSWKNDVSILFQNLLELWEHQSTLNYNMPLRGLIYYAHNIDGILRSKGISLYGKRS